MARRRRRGPEPHKFRDKLLLNQWLVSLLGIDTLKDDAKDRPFRVLSEPIRDPKMEGLDADRLHRFYHNLVASDLLWNERSCLNKDQLLLYEQNIVKHTDAINEKRYRPIVWKYYQWLSLLFVEIYLDRLFRDPDGLLADLNNYVARFNAHWLEREDIPPYSIDDLNKICLQNATGSGKTLLMHVNLLQYRHYAMLAGRDKELSRAILITPNEQLGLQHMAEFAQSGISAEHYLYSRGRLMGMAIGLGHVDVLEITKLGDQPGPNTVETRSLGEHNLLLVDEGHRGMSSGDDEGAWFSRRAALSAKGFTFEYSATFEQAAAASKNMDMENTYAKSVIFDYSYRWFYEDGFGKDYCILNLPSSYNEVRATYLTACLLKYYQQLRLYQDRRGQFTPFNLEKPLWVFVGNTVNKPNGTKDEAATVSDVAQVVQFVADFLANSEDAKRRVSEVLQLTGNETGLLDADGNDIFQGAFDYLRRLARSASTEDIYCDIIKRVFNNPAGGHLNLERIVGDSGEIALSAGNGTEPFGLINVGDAKGLCNHLADLAAAASIRVTVADSNFKEEMFESVKDSGSPINLLIGSKKFVEGWDCWRVSTLGLMHVGKKEGAQIIQLFGRGVRLKGYAWSLKRSAKSVVPSRPEHIAELETLNVFGVEADFMEKFCQFLRDEGLPGNEHRVDIELPMDISIPNGKGLKMLSVQKQLSGRAYSFSKNGPVPTLGEVPQYLVSNPVVSDWYPRIQSIFSSQESMAGRPDPVHLGATQRALLDFDQLWLELERFKRERGWHNLNITKEGIRRMLADVTWYKLYLPVARLTPSDFDGVRLLQQVAAELLKRFCEKYYRYCKDKYYLPRLEYTALAQNDIINEEAEQKYRISVNDRAENIVQQVEDLKDQLAQTADFLCGISAPQVVRASKWPGHLLQPLLHVRANSNVTVHPFSLNDSEYQFVEDLQVWCKRNRLLLDRDKIEVFLMRNNKQLGFFEAGNFHPDFMMWLLKGGKQYISFVEPHGLVHEGPGSEKVLFHRAIKDVEARLSDSKVALNSFILSWTEYLKLQWQLTQKELEDSHVLFMRDDRDNYIGKLFAILGVKA